MKVQQDLNKHHNFKDFNNIHVYLSQLSTVPRVSKLLYTKRGSRNPGQKNQLYIQFIKKYKTPSNKYVLQFPNISEEAKESVTSILTGRSV